WRVQGGRPPARTVALRAPSVLSIPIALLPSGYKHFISLFILSSAATDPPPPPYPTSARPRPSATPPHPPADRATTRHALRGRRRRGSARPRSAGAALRRAVPAATAGAARSPRRGGRAAPG